MKDSYILKNGDCFELMVDMDNGSVDLVLTDPPYGMELKPQREGAKFHDRTIINDDNLDWTDDFFKGIYRLLTKEGSAFIFCNHFCVSEFISSSRKAGFDIKNLIVWDKGHFGMGGNWRPSHELILIITKGRFVCKSKNLKSIIKFDKVYHNEAVHPTQKPVDLLEHLISEPDYEPEVIFDPFMGSGSTGVACMNLGKKFIGFELNEEYFDIAKKRIIEAKDNSFGGEEFFDIFM